MPSLGPKQLPPRSTRTHSASSRLLHSTTTLLSRAAKKALNTKKQNACKKARQRGEASPPPPPESYLRGATAELIVAACLRRLGLANTGVGNDPLREETKAARDVVEKVMASPGMKKVMDEAQGKVTAGRVASLRSLEVGPSGAKRGKKKAKKKKKEKGGEAGADAAAAYTAESGVFLTLNGDADAEGEATGGPSHRSPYGPGGDEDDEWAAVTSQRKNRKGQRARKAKAKAVEARKRGEKWDSSVNWREAKKPASEVDDSGLAVAKDAGTKIVLKAAVGGMGKEWKEKGKAHPSWAAKKADKGIVEFKGTKITFD